MAYKYPHFIPQNTAPKGTKRIGVYDGNGNKVCTIPLGGLTPPKKEKLYSFGVISDLHVSDNVYVAWQPIPKFDNALTYFENKGCVMCIACGDLTNTGFYKRTDEGTAGTEYLDEQQFAKYKEICDKHTIPVYEICGNHESYYGMPITNNLPLLETYTGKGVLSYTVTQGNDLFILCGQPRDSSVMSDADFEWLGETLEANKDRRCFVIVHSHIDDNVEGGVEDSGNPCYARENSIFGYWGATKRNNFINLMKQYPNVILFHGHTHIKFQAQEFDKDANYTEENGFKSVHVPSSGSPRTLMSADGTWKAADSESQGYIVDVYDDCIVLNGMDLINTQPIPLGVYQIDTISVETLLPPGYQRVDYIETTGTQYLDTGFTPNQDTRSICEFRHFDGSGICGARGSTSSKQFAFRLASGNWQPAYGTDLGSTGIAADEDWHIAEQDKNLFYLDGVLMKEFEYTTFTAPKTFILGGINANSKVYYGEGCYRSCKLYDNGTLVRDLVPCINPDGEIGMYDLVTKAFFGNSGTDSFIAGTNA